MSRTVGKMETTASEQVVRAQAAVRGWVARRRCARLARDTYCQCVDPASEYAYYMNVRSRPAILGDQTPMRVRDAGTKTTFPVEGSGHREECSTSNENEDSAPSVGDCDGSVFLARCAQDKRELFEEHRKKVRRSMRRWEHHQLHEKTRSRLARIVVLKADNETRLADLKKGARAYNLKSIRQAAVQGDIGRLVELLSLGFDADAPSGSGLTPLLGACQSGCLDAVKILLAHGADVNHHHIKTKRTCLMEASARESPEVVRELLRYGARVHVRDAHGESAFDCANDSSIKKYLEQAASLWSIESADLFPIPYRAAGRTLLLVQRRQKIIFAEGRTAMRRQLATLRPLILRSAAEAKMRYDEQARLSHAQATLLMKVEVLNRADGLFNNDRRELLKTVEQAIASYAEAERLRVLPDSAIHAILAFCDRHWFDPRSVQLPGMQEQRRRQYRGEDKKILVLPSRRRDGLHVLPASVDAEWSELQRELKECCEELHLAQTEEQPDVRRGIARNKDGLTLASLDICVRQGEYLPYRDPRLLVPIDPIVRIVLRDRAEPVEMLSTDCRLADRFPTWDHKSTFDAESVKGDLLLQVVDNKRGEVAGEATVSLRSLLDQKEHDEWITLPPTLRQLALEKSPREHAARVRLVLHLVHTRSILLTRQVQSLLHKRAEVLRRKRVAMQEILDDCIKKLTPS